jgi:hypothetical protein
MPMTLPTPGRSASVDSGRTPADPLEVPAPACSPCSWVVRRTDPLTWPSSS